MKWYSRSRSTAHDGIATGKAEMLATVGESSTTPASTAVKTNPLLTQTSREKPLAERCNGENMPENPVFYGQRTKIRRTKEQEMISAILELAEYGEHAHDRSNTADIITRITF